MPRNKTYVGILEIRDLGKRARRRLHRLGQGQALCRRRPSHTSAEHVSLKTS